MATTSSSAFVGCLLTMNSTVRTMELITFRSSAHNIARNGRFAMTTKIALRRSRRRGWSPLTVMRRRLRAAASACQATADVTISTLCPALRTRQHRSRSSRKIGKNGSRPPAFSHTSRLISIPAVDTDSTSRVPSCCPWSNSCGSSPVSLRPVRPTVTPISSSRLRSSQSRNFGPSTAALGSCSAAVSSSSSARLSGAQSSCSSQIHSSRPADGSFSSAVATDSPKPVERGREIRLPRPSVWASRSAEPSLLPLSTPATRSGLRLWLIRARSVSPSQRAPSWATTITVT